MGVREFGASKVDISWGTAGHKPTRDRPHINPNFNQIQRIPVSRLRPAHGRLIHPRLTVYNGGWAEIDEYYDRRTNRRRRSRK